MEKITVWLKCKKVVHFNQQVELTQKEYDLLNELDLTDVDLGDPEHTIIDRYIDLSEVFDSDDEYLEVQISNK